MKRDAPGAGPELVRVGRSGIEGRGVFAAVDLPPRRKLGELTGDLVRLPQARRAIEGDARIYFVELSRRWALDCTRGNAFKHLNHSCAPNCYLRTFRQRLEVYTLRQLPAGTELTVDYGQTPHRGGMRCHCGAPRCRGRL